MNHIADKDPEVRRYVSGTFWRITGVDVKGAKQTVPALIKSLKDDSSEFREQAAIALRRIDTEASKKAGVE